VGRETGWWWKRVEWAGEWAVEEGDGGGDMWFGQFLPPCGMGEGESRSKRLMHLIGRKDAKPSSCGQGVHQHVGQLDLGVVRMLVLGPLLDLIGAVWRKFVVVVLGAPPQ
jgi:hypothetical protein